MRLTKPVPPEGIIAQLVWGFSWGISFAIIPLTIDFFWPFGYTQQLIHFWPMVIRIIFIELTN